MTRQPCPQGFFRGRWQGWTAEWKTFTYLSSWLTVFWPDFFSPFLKILNYIQVVKNLFVSSLNKFSSTPEVFNLIEITNPMTVHCILYQYAAKQCIMPWSMTARADISLYLEWNAYYQQLVTSTTSLVSVKYTMLFFDVSSVWDKLQNRVEKNIR